MPWICCGSFHEDILPENLESYFVGVIRKLKKVRRERKSTLEIENDTGGELKMGWALRHDIKNIMLWTKSEVEEIHPFPCNKTYLQPLDSHTAQRQA